VARTWSSAGLHLDVECASSSVGSILAESMAGEPEATGAGPPDVTVHVQASRSPFPISGWSPLTRGAWVSRDRVLLQDACSSGLDLLLEPSDACLTVLARNRPDLRTRALSAAARSRHHLLTRAVLLQYPLLWWAGLTGSVPLHVSALVVNGDGTLLAGPGGTGKSTLLRTELEAGALALSDNLCATDGTLVHGVVEPLRIAGGTGRRMPHGRREAAWPRRATSLTADRILVLRRGDQARPVVRQLPAADVARSLVAGTYAAGELRRYWAFAATLALGTGLGPAHPPIEAVAQGLTARAWCAEILLPGQPGLRLRDLSLDEVAA
jgi:hypothetical protein